MRRLALHVSALSDAEYELYTGSLRDLAMDEGKVGKDEDAYFENIVVGVREARAWLRGRYPNVSAPVIDRILKLFAPNLGHEDTLSGSEFFAVLRLVVHAHSGREVDRSLAFVQADPSSIASASSQQPRSTAPSPAKRLADLPPPMPSRRPTYDTMTSSKSEPGSYNPFASQEPLPHPPLHPSQRTESSRSTTHNPFIARAPPPPKSEDGNSRIPPLPPRKPPPPIPSSSTSIPPPPPPRRSRVDRDRSVSPTKIAPVPPPKPPHHVTSTLMKESLLASKVAQSMKRAEEHLEKERVMQVLKSSSNTGAPYVYPARRAASPVRGHVRAVSSASSASGSLERSAPPLPRRRAQQPSPPMSASSLEQVALAAPPQSAKERIEHALSPFRSTNDIVTPPTTDRTQDGESSPVSSRSGPPPMHPDRKPYLGSSYQAPSSFEAVYGGMDSSPAPTDGSPTSRVFRSKSLHQPSSSSAHAPPPPMRRRRPESVQVVGSVGKLAQSFNGNTQGDGEQRQTTISRHGSLAKPSVHRRSSLSVSSLAASSRAASPTRHSASNSTSTPGAGAQSPLASLQRTFATLQPKLDAFQPRLDAARYKAEAGFSRRGFIPSSGMSISKSGSGTGLAGEEKEGLMGADDAHYHSTKMRGMRGHDEHGAGRSDDLDVDSTDSDEPEDAWRRSKGMGDVRSRREGWDTPSGDDAPLDDDARLRGRGRDVFDDTYSGVGRVGMEQDSLKWPVGDGWKPL